MSFGTLIAVVLVFLLLPWTAFLLSFAVRSRFARIFLCVGGLFFGLIFGLGFLLGLDCSTENFAYQNCRYAPRVFVDVANAATIPSMLLYFFVAPVFAIWALFREMKVRQYEQFEPEP